MIDLAKLEKWSRLIFVVSGIAWFALFWFKDKLPQPGFYDQTLLTPPTQNESEAQPFTITAGNQTYYIKPLYNYELNGIVVSSSSANDFTDIWHIKRWKDFLNLRDLCVVWGDNVASEIFRKVHYSSDSWTCWVEWSNRDGNIAFHKDQLSNNHLLTNSKWIQKKLMSAEVGDQIQLTGQLVEYRNPGNKFHRGTSITRTDDGNGACETIFLSNFRIIKKANYSLRLIYSIAKWLCILSFMTVIACLFIAPHEKYRK